MLKRHNPAAIAPAFARYSLGVEAPAAARWLYISGQVGVLPDGTLVKDTQGQIEAAFSNLLAILESAGMTAHDLVKITVFMTEPEDVILYRSVRERMLKDALPASTLIFIKALASPDWIIEVEGIAAAG